MKDEVFSPLHLKTTVLDLLRDKKRNLAWQLIDHYYSKSTKLEHFDVLGELSLKAEKRDTYLKCAEAAYALATTNDQLYLARANLYKAYNTMNYPEKALFYIEQNLKITPDDLETLVHKTAAMSLMNDKSAAEDLLLELEQKNPSDFKKYQPSFSSKLLREGKTSKGILSFIEAYKPKNVFFEDNLKMTRWRGSITPGKILYVDIEGGLGDQIINIRFFNMLQSYGMRPILVSVENDYYRDINALLRRHGYEILTDHLLINPNYQWAPMMSIPGYLGLTENQLWKNTYLTPLRQPKNLLTGTKPKIGIKCSGNPYFSQDEYRKIPIEQMLTIFPDNVDLYYIDKEPIDCNRVHDLSSRIETWEDTLDFIDQMDFIVSSCTSLVHAAGAIGKKTFVLTPIAEYYIWTSTRTDGSSPWYGNNFYIAKQTKVRDWSGPLNDIKNRIEKILKEHNE